MDSRASSSLASDSTIGQPWPHRGGWPEPHLVAQLGLNLVAAQSLFWVTVLILRLVCPLGTTPALVYLQGLVAWSLL